MAEATVRTLILDIDPGHDDAVAVLLALNHPRCKVLGVVATAGNQTLERTVSNARKVVALAGQDTPVVAGRPTTIMSEQIAVSRVHGDSGLEGVELRAEAPLLDRSAPGFVASLIESTPSPVTLVATGPLTNLAAFVLGYPELAARLERVVIMGGSISGGNVTPAAEFNFYVDPAAARVVLRSGLFPTVIGLDVTHRALLYPEELMAIKDLGSKQALAVWSWLEFYGAQYRRRNDWDGIPIHDAVAVLDALEPELVTKAAMAVDVESGPGVARGQLVADRRPGRLAMEANALVGVDVNRARFVDLLIRGLARYGDEAGTVCAEV